MRGILKCPLGLHDTCIPLVLPDGTDVGRVMAGQVMTDEQNENGILEKTKQLGFDDDKVLSMLSHMKKPRREMESAFLLLRQLLSYFMEKSYNLWKSRYAYEFVCTDNVYGMSEETLEKLFEPSARASDERMKMIQGTGLGMAITKNIVRVMGGDITVDSKPDKGSRFAVTFRLKLQSDSVQYNDVCQDDNNIIKQALRNTLGLAAK